MRTGLICKKLGMSRVFDSNGSHIPVTILHPTYSQKRKSKSALGSKLAAVESRQPYVPTVMEPTMPSSARLPIEQS